MAMEWKAVVRFPPGVRDFLYSVAAGQALEHNWPHEQTERVAGQSPPFSVQVTNF